MIKVQVIIGSTREGRFGDKPAKMILDELKKNKELEAELIDLRDWPLPFFNEPTSPNMSGGKYTSELAANWAEKIGQADAYIVTVAEYNNGYTAVLKNAFDYAYKQWNNKPIAFIGYGGISGGIRAIQQLRQVVIELQMAPIRNAVYIPMYWTKLDEGGNLKPDEVKGTQEMIDQLLWWTKALQTAREKSL